MHKLTHFRLCPHSRSIRLALAELGIETSLTEERPWEWRPAFLALNPAGELPVLEIQGGPLLCGAYSISEFISEDAARPGHDGRPVPLFPGDREDRAEARRIVDWFHAKFDREVTRELMAQKVHARLGAPGAAVPDTDALRAIRTNLAYHLRYITYLVHQRRWLAGDELSFADLAAAAHISCLDYLGEVPWDHHPAVKQWYVRIKSRRAFRGLLEDRIPGLAPPLSYTDLDF